MWQVEERVLDTNTSEEVESSENMQLEAMELNAPKQLRKGQTTEATVVMIDDEFVWVDLQSKYEGKIRKDEFTTLPNENDVFTVLYKGSDSNGAIVSKRDAEKAVMREALYESYENDGVIKGRVSAKAKNGLIVDFNGIEGYAPMSHMELRRLLAAEHYIGNEYEFKILKLETRGRRISLVVSRKDLLKVGHEVAIATVFDNMNVGDVVEGVVRSLRPIGAFVDIGGVDGLLRVSDMSWKRGISPKNIVQENETVKVKIISMDKEKERIALSIKALESDPFVAFCEENIEGGVVDGKVVKLEVFGAFVEVAAGVEGLLHVSELSWTQRVNHPKDILQVGAEIQVKILKIDSKERRLSLGYRQMLANPYDTFDLDYPVGTKHTGKIVKVLDFGAFVALPSGVEGLLRKEDVSWEKGSNNSLDKLVAGEMIEVVVLRCDKKNRKIALGLKQMVDNPYGTFKFDNPVGSKVTGKVVKITDFGAFVELAPGIEGLLHISELSDKRVESVEDVVKVGEEVKVKILDLDEVKQKISLSIKAYDKESQKEMVNKFQGTDSGTFKLGDIMDLSGLGK